MVVKTTNGGGGVQREPLALLPQSVATRELDHISSRAHPPDKRDGPFAKEPRVKEHHPVIFQTTGPPGTGTPRRQTDTTRVRAYLEPSHTSMFRSLPPSFQHVIEFACPCKFHVEEMDGENDDATAERAGCFEFSSVQSRQRTKRISRRTLTGPVAHAQ